MKVEIYVCDRCGEDIRMKTGKQPNMMWRYFEGNDKDDNIEYHLCENCSASLSFFTEHIKEFDKLADDIAKKELGE